MTKPATLALQLEDLDVGEDLIDRRILSGEFRVGDRVSLPGHDTQFLIVDAVPEEDIGTDLVFFTREGHFFRLVDDAWTALGELIASAALATRQTP